MGGFFLFNNVLFWPSAYPFQLPKTVNFLTSWRGLQNSSPAPGEVAVRPEEGDPARGVHIRPRRSRGTPSNLEGELLTRTFLVGGFFLAFELSELN